MGITDILKGKGKKKKPEEVKPVEPVKNATEEKTKKKEKPDSKGKKEKIKVGNRKSREYVGEEISGENQEPEKEDKKPDKKEKLFLCPVCYVVREQESQELQSGIVFKKEEELVDHLYEVHGISTTPEDATRECTEYVLKANVKALLEYTKETIKTQAKEEIEAQKRVEAVIATPKDNEPKRIVRPGEVKDATDVYNKVLGRLSTGDTGGADGDEVYQETISGEEIEITMVKRFPKTPEVLNLLSELKKHMM